MEVEQEEDGRWLGEVVEMPGVLAYGQTRAEAVSRAEALALRVLAEQIEIVLPAAAPTLDDRYPLRGIVVDYQRPTEPVAEQDWDASRA